MSKFNQVRYFVYVFLLVWSARGFGLSDDDAMKNGENLDLVRRQEGPRDSSSENIDGQCGKTFGECALGYCCSAAGWCGKGLEYCAAPDCQLDYGSGCDGNKMPGGASTADVPRVQTNPSFSYDGTGVYFCVVPKTVALTFDDGPYKYTDHVLDLLQTLNAKATFFITGNNLGKGEIDNPAYPWADIIRRMHESGHQIASHTWSHQNLSNISEQQMKNQVYWNEMAFRNILGFFPQYIRPPYSSCNERCQIFLKSAGYHTIYFDVDTEDYLNDSPQLIQKPKDIVFAKATSSASRNALVIEHDIHNQTAYNLAEYTITEFQAQGYRLVTVGECLGDIQENWYRYPGKVPVPAPPGNQPSITGRCGPDVGLTCQGSTFGNCCSAAGWCGSSSVYCNSGCQTGFGTCQVQDTPQTPDGTQLTTSYDGTCGRASGFTCNNSPYGGCCSEHNFCGSTPGYCNEGCQPGFGSCGNKEATSGPKPSPPAQSQVPVSQNGKCGSRSKTACSSGSCCIQFYPTQDGQCYAGEICQLYKANCKKEFGTC